MLKKMMLLAGMALAAIAFAVPASASAEEWKHGGEPLAEDATVHLTGHIKFTQTSEFDPSMDCNVTANVLMTAGTDAGHVTAFTIDTTSCIGGGALAKCEVETATASGLNWPVTIVGGALGINGFDFTNVYKSSPECPSAGTTFIDNGAPEWIFTPSVAGQLCHFNVSGTMAGNTDVTGTFKATTCTYEIG